MIKRSIYYVTRKKKRSLIIMMILTIILSCLYISSSITIAAAQLEKTMYEAANTSLSVTKINHYLTIGNIRKSNKLKAIHYIMKVSLNQEIFMS